MTPIQSGRILWLRPIEMIAVAAMVPAVAAGIGYFFWLWADAWIRLAARTPFPLR